MINQKTKVDTVLEFSNAVYPFRMAGSGSQKGKHETRYYLTDAPYATCSTTQTWSSKGIITQLNTSASIGITENVLRFFDSPVVRGKIILDVEMIAPRRFRAIWAEQATGYNLRTANGFFLQGFFIQDFNYIRACEYTNRLRKQKLEILRSKRKLKV